MAFDWSGLEDEPAKPSGGFDWSGLEDEPAPESRFTPDQLAAEATRQKTGKRKQFDEENEWDLWTPEHTAFWKDAAAPLHNPDARRQIKDPALGLPASIASAAESIPVAITNLGATPVDENPQASATARLSQGIAGGVARAALTAPLGPLAFGVGEATAKTADIATDDPMAFSERPKGTAGRIAAAGIIPGAASKVAGAVVPRIAESVPAAYKIAAGTLAGAGVEFAGNELQKGIEYIGGTNEPTMAGLGQALIPTREDLIALAPGVAGSAIQAKLSVPQKPGAQPQVLDRTDIRDTPLDPYSYRARAEGIMDAERQIMEEAPFSEVYNVPLLEYNPARGRTVEYGSVASEALDASLSGKLPKDAPIPLVAGSAIAAPKKSARDVRREAVSEGMYGSERMPLDSMVKLAKERGITGRDAIEAQWPHLTREQAKAVRDRVVGRTAGPLAAQIESAPDFIPLSHIEAMNEGNYSTFKPNFLQESELYPKIEPPLQPESGVIPSELRPREGQGQTRGPLEASEAPPIALERPVISSKAESASDPAGSHIPAPQDSGDSLLFEDPDMIGRYHGTSSPIKSLSDDKRKGAGNLFGSGLYTTDDLFTAEGYTLTKGKGRTPHVYGIKWKGSKPPNLIDLEDKLPDGAVLVFRKIRDSEIAENGKSFVPEDFETMTAGEVYLKTKENLINEVGLGQPDAETYLEDLTLELSYGAGYDGFKHTGGGRLRSDDSKNPHKVEIYFEPEKNVELVPLPRVKGRLPQSGEINEVVPTRKSEITELTDDDFGLQPPPQPPPTPPTPFGGGDEGQPPKDPRYAGGFNKRLFGMKDNPGLQEVYERQAQRNPAQVKGMTRAEVREAANTAPTFDIEKLRKIKSFDDVRDFTPVEKQVLSDQTDYFANKRLAGELDASDQAMFDELTRATKIARGAPGSDLSLLNQNAIARAVESGNYRAAALKALDDASPTGKAPEAAIKAVREMANDPLSMARTVYRESRRNHGFLQTFVTSNLLSNVLGTAPLNMASNIMNLAAQTALRKGGTRGAAAAGAVRGAGKAYERAKFAGKEGFSMDALTDPRIAAKAPGFAAGGAKNPFNWGGRAAFAGDEFIKGMAEQSHLDVMAKAQALERAGGDKAKAAQIEADLKANPTPEMIKEAKEYGKTVSYQMEPDEATGLLSRLINWAPIAPGTRAEIKPIKLAIPFFSTIMNVAKANVALSPAGSVAGIIQGARGKVTPGQAVTQAAMGLIPTAIGVGLAERGIITGPIPDNAAEREAFFEAGKKPWTIQIGEYQIPLAWAGPFALSLGLGAALKDAKRQGAQGKIPEDMQSIGLAAAGNAFDLFMEGSPLVTLNSVLEAVARPSERNIKKLATNLGSEMMPLVSLQGFLNRQNVIPALRDEYLRDTSGQTALEEVLNGIVARSMASRSLPKRISNFGTELDRPGQITQSPPDPVYSELYRMGITLGPPSKQFAGLPGQKEQTMTPEEYRSVLLAAKPAHDRLTELVQSQEYMNMPENQRRILVQNIVEKLPAALRNAQRKRVRASRIAAGATQVQP